MTIYLMRDKDYRPMYVGKTTLSVNERLRLHRVKANGGSNSKVHVWLRSNPSLVLEELSDVYTEEQWIAILDTPLNTCPHGDGTRHVRAKGWHHTDDAKEKISKAMSGKLAGRTISEETRKKRSIAIKGRNFDHRRYPTGVCNICGLRSNTQGLSQHKGRSGHDDFSLDA